MTPTYPASYSACFWVCLALVAPRIAQNVEPAPSGGALVPASVAVVEMRTPKTSYYVGEELNLELRFGFERRFLESNLIQLFHRELDLPVQLLAPSIDELPGALAIPVGPPARDDPPPASFALNEERDHARVVTGVTDGETSFEMYAVERRYLPERAGTLSIPAPAMRFAYATSFREDLFGGRVADDRIEASVRGKALELVILPLPEAGRPADFTGAVGVFSVSAQADPRDLNAGQSLKLELHIEGRGNLETLLAPRLDRLRGFHVYGMVEEHGPGWRTAVYDLAPLSEEIQAVPAIGFSYFDPDPPAGYRSVETRPIPILVRPAPRAPAPADSAPPSDHPARDQAAVSTWAWAGGALVLALGAWLLWAGRHRTRS